MKLRVLETCTVSWARDGLPFVIDDLSATQGWMLVEDLQHRARNGERISIIRRIMTHTTWLDVTPERKSISEKGQNFSGCSEPGEPSWRA